MKRLGLIKRCFSLIFRCAPTAAALTCICYFVQKLFSAVLTWAIAGIVDSVVSGEGTYVYLTVLLASFLAVCVAGFVLAIALNAGVFEKSNAYCRVALAEKAAQLELIQFENPALLDCRSGAMDCVENETFGMVYMLSVQILSGAGSLLAISAVLWSYHPALVLMALLSMVPLLIVRIVRGTAMYRLRRAQIPEVRKAQYYYSLFSDRSLVKEIRLMSCGPYLLEKWSASDRKSKKERLEEQDKDVKSVALCEAVTILFLAAAIGLCLYLTLGGRLSPGVFGACLFSFQRMQRVAQDLFTSIGGVPNQLGALENYFSFLDLKCGRNGSAGSVGVQAQISLSQVRFAYPSAEKDALKGLDLSVRKGETVAIVGENGSGKTTLTKLLIGLYHPTEGRVCWDQTDLEQADLGAVMDQVAVVAQQPVKLLLPLAESLRLTDGRPTDAQIRGALSQVGLNQLAQLDDLSVMLGKEFQGIDLSGGEWQRLALARCILKDAPVCVLDEPTSALDPIAEMDVLKSFIEISKNRTAFIVTHRVGICRYVDRILVLKDGEIVENGSHEQLMAQAGEYAAMFQTQKKWYVRQPESRRIEKAPKSFQLERNAFS